MAKRALVKATPALTQPFSIGCFRFTGTGVEVHGRPTFSETQGAWDFTTRAHKSAGHWMIDMIAYIDSRADWGDKRDTLISHETGLSDKSVGVYRSIGKRVPPANRVEGAGVSQLAVVAKLEDAEQRAWLERSVDEGWSTQELKSEITNAKRQKLLSGKAAGVFRIEVVLYLEVEAGSVLKAEALAQGAVERMTKVLEAPILAASVHAVRPR